MISVTAPMACHLQEPPPFSPSPTFPGRIISVLHKDVWLLRLQAVALAALPIGLTILSFGVSYLTSWAKVPFYGRFFNDMTIYPASFVASGIFKNVHACWKEAKKTQKLLLHWKTLPHQELTQDRLWQILPYLSLRQTRLIFKKLHGSIAHSFPCLRPDQMEQEFSQATPEQIASCRQYLASEFSAPSIEKSFSKTRLQGFLHMLHFLYSPSSSQELPALRQRLQNELLERQQQEAAEPLELGDLQRALGYIHEADLLAGISAVHIPVSFLQEGRLLSANALNKYGVKDLLGLKKAALQVGLKAMLGDERLVLPWLDFHGYHLPDCAHYELKKIFSQAAIYRLSLCLKIKNDRKVVKKRLQELRIELSCLIQEGVQSGDLIPGGCVSSLLELKSFVAASSIARKAAVGQPVSSLEYRGFSWKKLMDEMSLQQIIHRFASFPFSLPAPQRVG